MAEKKAQEAAAKNGSSSAFEPASTPVAARENKPEPKSTPSPVADSPAPDDVAPVSPASQDEKPVKYAGKFDPKAIAKRAAAAMERQKAALGGDVLIPKSANGLAKANFLHLADSSAHLSNGRPNGMSTLEAYRLNSNVLTVLGVASAVQGSRNAKVSGFGLNKTNPERPGKTSAMKSSADLGEHDGENNETKRTIEKLPSLFDNAAFGASTLADVDEDQDADDSMRSDDEDAEASREAAQKRAQDAQAATNDVDMQIEAAVPDADTKPDVDQDMEDADEPDPLDAFMNDLVVPVDNDMPNLAIGRSKKKQLKLFDDNEGDDLEAVGQGTEDILNLTSKRKKKDIPTVNHGNIQYEPFRKNFYAEGIELAEMDDEEVEQLRQQLDNIKVRGKEPPKPILKFSQGGFGTQILDVITGMGYETPTSIQSQALPAIMSGRDTIGIAKTGSGKTVAFILPMFRHIKDQRPLDNMEGPIGLILAPTRELATQIHKDCKPYLKSLNLRAVCAYGGAPIKDQIAELKRGGEIVVCTPGRMIDLLAANSGRVTNLRRVTYVVLD